MDLSTIATFVVAVFLISASPGPAVALILRRAALPGFAELVAASETAYLVLRAVGAGVLIYLGVRSWRSAWRLRTGAEQTGEHQVEPGSATGRREWWRGFAEGVVVQLANPKAAVFMLAFYPQFVPADRPLFTTTARLALLQVALETALYLALAAGVARAGRWFSRAAVRRRLETVTGAVLVALGARIAFVSRGA